ncbi:MAG: 3-oxoacyl-ACP reductase [Thiotrichales bacterium]|nr:3-oxoacyl-ACP reductase [Thiotrichales bacterium]
MDIDKKHIAVTGAGRGLGAAIAEQLGQYGAIVHLIDVDDAALQQTSARLSELGLTTFGYSANIADEKSVGSVFKRIADTSGGLDGLVNNAGITRDGLLVKKKDGVTDFGLSLEQWRAVLDVNLTGVFLCGREAALQMVAKGRGGVIVNISSLSREGNMGQSNYSAAKAGVHALTVVWSKELSGHGIRTGTIAPGFIDTEMTQAIRPDVRDKITATIPLRRMGGPEHIAQGVRFIFEHDYFTGRCLEIDGGMRL